MIHFGQGAGLLRLLIYKLRWEDCAREIGLAGSYRSAKLIACKQPRTGFS